MSLCANTVEDCVAARLQSGSRVCILSNDPESTDMDKIQRTSSGAPGQLIFLHLDSEFLPDLLSCPSTWAKTHAVIGSLTDISKMGLSKLCKRYSSFSFCIHMSEITTLKIPAPKNIPPPTKYRHRRFSVSAEPLPETQEEEEEPKEIHKSEETKENLLVSLKKIPFFAESDLNKMLGFVTRRSPHSAGKVIVHQNDTGEELFIIESGIFQVSCDGQVIAILGTLQHFGELSLLYCCRRTATVTQMSEEGILWTLNRRAFRSFIRDSVLYPRKQCMSFFQQVPFLKSLSTFSLDKLIGSCEAQTYCPEQELPLEPSCIYIVKSGDLRLNFSDGGRKTISEYGVIVLGANLDHSAIRCAHSGEKHVEILCIMKKDYLLSFQ